MKLRLTMFSCFLALTALGQNPSGFEKMATKMEGNAAPIITREQLIKEFESNKNIVLLDSREKDEFEVSHLPNAKWVGFKDYHFDVLKNISKDTEIVVYCSVGYRSGKTAEKLIKKGYTKVYNLYGGIFDWANNNKTLEKTNGDTTKEVHGYNQKWSEYLNSEVTKPIVK